MVDEVGQEVELLRGQLHRRARDRDRARGPVDRDLAERRHVFGGRRIGAPQDGTDARHELAGGERLRDVVVRSQLQTGDAVDLLVPRRQDDDR